MTRQVVMDKCALEGPPPAAIEHARGLFEEIAEGLEGIPAGNNFWRSVAVSRLMLVVRGWCFFYTLDEKELRVTQVRRE